jgi:predicted NBD/HSP70 family sugar kinase
MSTNREQGPGQGVDQRAAGALAVLRLVHERPGIPRSEAARLLGISSGSATEITARLRERELLTERPPGQALHRGRPSGLLLPHPAGPLVCAVEIAYGGWRLAAVELGGEIVHRVEGRRARTPAATLADVRRGLAGLHAELGPRIRAVGVSVSGTVSGDRLLQAATLRWSEVDLRGLVPDGLEGLPFTAGNDATLAGLAEARRGAATDAAVVLYLAVEVGIGGVLVVDGRPLAGARGEGGEFGHMPFGDEGLRCPCGATGCWDLEVDGRALARALGRRAPADPRAFATRVIEAAQAGGAAESEAVAHIAAALGRGTGALVNALDPDLVVYGGLAPDVHHAARGPLESAYHEALMRHRRHEPPPLVAAATGSDGSLLGAAELAFDLVLAAPLLSARP